MLPLKSFAKETLKGIVSNTKKLKVVTQSSVCEENTGAIVVASSPRMNPTGTFIDVKYHWFRSHIDSDNNGSNPISIKKIYEKVNTEDIFTKSKSKESVFLALRIYCVGGKDIVGKHPL